MKRGVRTRYFAICHMIIYALFEGLILPNKKQGQCKIQICNPTIHKMSNLHKVLIYEIVLDTAKAKNIHRSRGGFA